MNPIDMVSGQKSQRYPSGGGLGISGGRAVDATTDLRRTGPSALKNRLAKLIFGWVLCLASVVSGAVPLQGRVEAWGDNLSGQCQVPAGLANVTAIAAGGYHTVALREDGTVVAWGHNLSGQCDVPAGLSGVTAIAAGQYHTVVLKSDGTVDAWGDNLSGQCDVPLGLSGVTAIAAGRYHTLALKSDGTVAAWGYNLWGQCNVPPGLNGVTAISGGGDHSVVLKSDGTVAAWGYNLWGQCTVPAGLNDVTAIAAGGFHTLALKDDGTVAAWGLNLERQCNVPAGLTGVRSIAAGAYHSMALTAYGTVQAWGADSLLFNYDQTDVPAGLSAVTALASGGYHSLALINQNWDDVVVTGQTLTPAEGLTGGGVMYRPMPGVINEADQVALKVYGKVGTGGILAANDSMVLTDASSVLRVIAREGTLTGPTPAAKLNGLFYHPLLTTAGATVVHDRILGSTTSRDYAYLASPDGVALISMVRTGDVSPVGAGTHFSAPTSAFVAEAGGDVYYSLGLSGAGVTARTDSALWKDDLNDITLIAREGDDVSALTGDSAWIGAISAKISASGDGTSFIASLQNNPADFRQRTDINRNMLVLDSNGAGLRKVLRKGDVVLDTAGKVLKILNGVSRSATGAHAVLGLLKLAPGVTAATDQVLLSVSGGVTRLVVREGVTQIGGKTLSAVKFFYAIGDEEIVLMTDNALCRWTLAGGLEPLACVGEPAPGQGTHFLQLAQVSVSEGGAIALNSRLGDTRSALWRALPGEALSFVLASGDATTVQGVPSVIRAFSIHSTGYGAGGGGEGECAGINDQGTLLVCLSTGGAKHVARRLYP